MWPIIKKELRENARYLLGACAVVLFFMDCAACDAGWNLVGVARLLFGVDRSHVDTTSDAGLNRQLEVFFIYQSLLVTGAIALAQVYREQHRKTWPLLSHLPMPGSRMVFAKVLAGLLMYLIVFLPAALLIVARLNTPGVWPGPIYVYMFFPMLAYFLAGALFYLATFLCAFRPARWYATKWLPLLVVIPAYSVAKRAIDFLDPPRYYVLGQSSESSSMHMSSLLIPLAVTLLSLLFVLWAIREQARTREY